MLEQSTGLSMDNTNNLKKKLSNYEEVLQNTISYREIWQKGLKKELGALLKKYAEAVGLSCKIEHKAAFVNLEAIVLSLGAEKSGIFEEVLDGIKRPLIKQNGTLLYQQLFNGKIMVAINYPFIEKYGEQQPLKPIAIYRPEELKEAYILRHLETFLEEMTKWEDYDDDKPEANQRIGYKMNFNANPEEVKTV